MLDAGEYDYATLGQLEEALATGAVSSEELTAAAIGRIEKIDPRINAVPVRDFDCALVAAKTADARRAQGETGALLGVPMTVKESFNVAGLPTTFGIPPFKDFVPTEDALVVQRLREAGAIVLGKTNVPVGLGDLQSYNPIYGTTNNPWDLSKTPGGSSGGSAAALAAGFGAVSIGSDIAGSLRLPAHFTGVFAHKPTFGLVPGRGHVVPMMQPLDYNRDLTVVGPMARSAADLRTVLELLAVPDPTGMGRGYTMHLPAPRHETLGAFRVLVLPDYPTVDTSVEVRAGLQKAASALEAAGATVVRSSDLLPDVEQGAKLYMRLLLASIAASYPPDVYAAAASAAAEVAIDDETLEAERRRGAGLSFRDWVAADNERTVLGARWAAFFDQYDAVLCPASPTTAFDHDHTANQWARTLLVNGREVAYADQLVWAGVASAPGLPATVLPVGTSADGLPVGVQLVGPKYEDLTIIRLAELLERELGEFTPPPLT